VGKNFFEDLTLADIEKNELEKFTVGGDGKMAKGQMTRGIVRYKLTRLQKKE